MLVGLLTLISGVKIKRGRLTSPFGTEFNGIEVSFGGAIPLGETVMVDNIKRELGERIIHDERDVDGRFKRLTISFE